MRPCWSILAKGSKHFSPAFSLYQGFSILRRAIRRLAQYRSSHKMRGWQCHQFEILQRGFLTAFGNTDNNQLGLR
jgi:hypothetical protein